MTAMVAALTRIDEIRAMMTPAAPPATATGGFQAALDAAQAPTAAPAPAIAAAGPAGAGVPFAAEIDAAAARHGVDPALLRGLVRQESNFDPSARSPAGASGLTQLMPATARSLGVTNALDPAQALDGGARYLRQQLDAFGGDVAKALAAYNAGPGAVQRFGGIPPYPETQTYVQRVMAYADEYRTAAPAAAVAAQPAPPAAPAPLGPSGGLPYSTL